MHYTVMSLVLQVWPKSSARVYRYEALSWWVWSWRRFGLTDAQIASRLGVPYERLRRKGALKRADEHQTERRGARARAPVIVAVEREHRPSQLETWYDPRLAEFWPETAKQLAKEISHLTRAGPWGGELKPVEVQRPQPGLPRKPKQLTTDKREIARFFRLHSGEPLNYRAQ
jgi:hypothetical protein